MAKCEHYECGFCTCYKSVEDQWDNETQWECSGSEEDMIDCGMLKIRNNSDICSGSDLPEKI